MVLMELLYTALRSPEVHHSVKPQIIAAFGDAALALGGNFAQVYFHTLSMLAVIISLSFWILFFKPSLRRANYVLIQPITKCWIILLN